MSRQLARWRLYGLPGGWTVARRVTAGRPQAPLSPRAVVLVEYRDRADALRSPRWSAALDWVIREYNL